MQAFVSKLAPAFSAQAYNPKTKAFAQMSLEALKGKKVLLAFYPLDFTFVCPTEIVALSNLNEEFAKRNTQVICCSTDSHFSHKAWAELDVKQGGFGNQLQIPLLSGDMMFLIKSLGKSIVFLRDFGIQIFDNLYKIVEFVSGIYTNLQHSDFKN